MNAKVEVHVLCFNEAEILGYTLRHYRTFCAKMIVHDGGSDDGSQEIAKLYGAEVRPWNTEGKLNDGLAVILKNTCWLGTDADWVICADADELIYFPLGAEFTLESYAKTGAAVIKPYGFEMFSEKYPTTDGQIYDEVKMGARDDYWYGKPILFTPHRVEESGFGLGAHESDPLLTNGRRLHIAKDWPKPMPPAYLLHFHQIGPAQRIADRYDSIFGRFSALNIRHGWGNHTPGAIHVQQKRDLICPRLVPVIP